MEDKHRNVETAHLRDDTNMQFRARNTNFLFYSVTSILTALTGKEQTVIVVTNIIT